MSSTTSTWAHSSRPTGPTDTAAPRTSLGVLLGVLLYAYCTGVRSSRRIERRLKEDIAFRVLAGNQAPDHVTIAPRFRVRPEQALAGRRVASLKLCAAAGLVRLGLVALDGMKVEANAAERANRTHAHSRRRSPSSWSRPPRRTGPRTASTAPAAAMRFRGRWLAGPSGWPACNTPRVSRRPRPPNANAATSSGSPNWPPLLGPRPTTPGPYAAAAARRGAQPQRHGHH
jgi:transposase-like protein DUF772